MQIYGKAWLTFVAIQCTAVSVVLGAYYGIKTNMIALKDEIHSLEQRVQLLEKSLNEPSPLLPAQKATQVIDAGAPVAPSVSAAAPEHAGDKSNPPINGVPSSTGPEKPGERTTCVNKMTHTVFACERAAKCLGPNNFDGTYFKNLRTKLGLGDSDSMMICDERTAETGSAPVEAH